MLHQAIPPWAEGILCSPGTTLPVGQKGAVLLDCEGAEVARIEQSIVRFPVNSPNETTEFYRRIGGPHFHERSSTPFAMSALDTPVYHQWVEETLPVDRDGVVVDVGGGDGRNAVQVLRNGYRKVVVVDVVGEALVRFRTRIAQSNPEWLGRLLLIEADARNLPLASGCAEAVFSIETLCYLNEEYERGLVECTRLLASAGKILLADRDYEGGLILRLLYHGIEAMLEMAGKRDLWDGRDAAITRSRCFTEIELLEQCRSRGLKIVKSGGVSVLSLILGYLNGRNTLQERDAARAADVQRMLIDLGRHGTARRSHVIIARQP